MEWIKKWMELGKKYRLFGLDVIRIYIGIGILMKGIHFILHPEQLNVWLQSGNLADVASMSMSQFQQIFIIYYVIFVHTFGGFLLIIGLLTRLAALMQVPVIMGAILFVHLQEGFFTMAQNLEFAVLVLFINVVLVFVGSDKLSLDFQVNRLWEKLKHI